MYLNQLMAVNAEAELAHQHERLFRADNLHLRITQKNFLDRGAVIRLHMVDYQVIKRFSLQQIVHIFKQLAAGRPVNSVK